MNIEVIEATTEVGRGVGIVLHDVGGEPKFLDAEFLQFLQSVEGFIHGLHTVIDTWEDMAVEVGHALEETAVEEGVFLFREGPHGVFKS